MKEKDQTVKTALKAYPEQEHVSVVSEPEVLYETTPAMSFEEDFNRALATAITMEEFTQHMYKRIEAWPWKEK